MLLTNRFICISTGAQILDTDFFCTTVQEPVQNTLSLNSCTKKPPNKTKQTKTRNKGKDKECGSIYSQLVRLSLPSTHLHSPSPITLTLQSASLSRTAALSAKRGNSLSPWKDKRSPQANWDNSRLLKIVGHTSCSPMCPPKASRRILREWQKNPKCYKSEMYKKLGTSITHFFFVKQRQQCKDNLQSAFSCSPTVVMMKAKQTLPTSSTLCCQTDYKLKKIFLLVAWS